MFDTETIMYLLISLYCGSIFNKNTLFWLRPQMKGDDRDNGVGISRMKPIQQAVEDPLINSDVYNTICILYRNKAIVTFILSDLRQILLSQISVNRLVT